MMSIEAALRDQKLTQLYQRCCQIVPNIWDQYSDGVPEEHRLHWELKTRAMHAWQTQCMLRALDVFGKKRKAERPVNVVDIGDSAGNHFLYLRACAEVKLGRTLSVNLDRAAIEKIKRKGGDAILCRAEELDLGADKVDLFMAFEMVEHLTDPVRFLHNLAVKGTADYLLMSVPYRRVSQVGFHEFKDGRIPGIMTAEAVHIFELCPREWLLLAQFAGWKPVFTDTFLQYPRYSPLRITKPLWQRLDFEGFFGVLLERDLTVANQYRDW